MIHDHGSPIRDIPPAKLPRFDPTAEQFRLRQMLGRAYDPGYYHRSNQVEASPLADPERAHGRWVSVRRGGVAE